jgi:hypothetical protein
MCLSIFVVVYVLSMACLGGVYVFSISCLCFVHGFSWSCKFLTNIICLVHLFSMHISGLVIPFVFAFDMSVPTLSFRNLKSLGSLPFPSMK